MRLARIAAIGLSALALALAQSAGATTPVPADGAALLRRIYEKNTTVTTLQAPFTQVKESSLFASSITSTGKIAFARPARLRWELTSKPRSVLVVNGDKVTLHYPDLGKTEKFDRAREPSLGALFDQLFVWLGAADPAKVTADYAVTLAPGPAALVFTPLREPVKSALLRVTVTFDAASLVVNRVEIDEKTGDRTVITFGAPVVNAVLPDTLFEVK